MLNENEYMALRATLTIDPNDLDGALINLAMDQMTAAEYTSAASAIKDQAEFHNDQVIADVSATMRNSAGKPSEARIKSETALYDEVVQANYALIEASRDYAKWRGLADAIRTKGTSLGVISDLIKAGYMTPNTMRTDRRETIHQYRQQQPYSQRGTNIGNNR